MYRDVQQIAMRCVTLAQVVATYGELDLLGGPIGPRPQLACEIRAGLITEHLIACLVEGVTRITVA